MMVCTVFCPVFLCELCIIQFSDGLVNCAAYIFVLCGVYINVLCYEVCCVLCCAVLGLCFV
jgi:hypothetical protein